MKIGVGYVFGNPIESDDEKLQKCQQWPSVWVLRRQLFESDDIPGCDIEKVSNA
jgi:hypothetical protein